MEAPTDSHLIEKAKNGDIDSFKVLVTSKESKVAEIVLSTLGEATKAEDIGQEIFLRLYDRLDKIGNKLPIDTYLLKLSAEFTLHELRQRTKLSFHNHSRENSSIQKQDFSEQLAIGFSSLDPHLQLLLTLRIIIGYSIEEIIKILNLPLERLVSQLALAQHRLKQHNRKSIIKGDTLLKEEVLLLKSWDASLNKDETNMIAGLIQNDASVRKLSDEYHKIRETLKSKKQISFGPFFSERVLHVLKQRKENLDYQFAFYFKRYQLLIIGILAALFILNLSRSEDVTLKAFFGLEEAVEDNFTIDLYEKYSE